MASSNEEAPVNDVTLERLLSIWPITSCFATYTSAGDLISLSRTSSTIRALTHGFPISHVPTSEEARRESLRLGRHQTIHWFNLKASSRFTCSSPTHPLTKEHPTQPCHFCSRPICRACIVRTFFANPHENTFKHRTRYFCPKCWDSGNLRKDFRYSTVEHVSREHIWQGRSYLRRGSFCSCSASVDNWLCISCKNLQNVSAPTNQTLTAITITGNDQTDLPKVDPNRELTTHHMECYGLDCDNEINEADRDRRRICLWCSKPLPRQFAGEDRLRWETKQVEIRAAAAASRSADIAEWARNRFRTLTMSRRVMRGSAACLALTDGKDSPEHDQPLFVRHLDAVNYRSFMSEREVPSPENVYRSKHGRWVYNRSFMQWMNLKLMHNQSTTAINGVNIKLLKELTHHGTGLKNARTNAEVFTQLLSLPECDESLVKHGTAIRGRRASQSLVRYQALLLEARLLDPGDDIADVICEIQNDIDDLNHVLDSLFQQVDSWEGLDDEGKKQWMPRNLRSLTKDAGYPETGMANPKKSIKAEGNVSEADELLTYEDVERLGAGAVEPDLYDR